MKSTLLNKSCTNQKILAENFHFGIHFVFVKKNNFHMFLYKYALYCKVLFGLFRLRGREVLKPGFGEATSGVPSSYARSSASSAVSNATGSSGTGGSGTMVSRYSHYYSSIFSSKFCLLEEQINNPSVGRTLCASFPSGLQPMSRPLKDHPSFVRKKPYKTDR